MNKEIKIFLNQEVTENDDGMDMSICLIDKDIHTVKFAGAMNPLVFIQKNKMSIFEGNKHSLGGIQLSKEIKKFETTEITYTDNCYLYLFSDGFEDQHNEEGKRYTQEKLKQTLFDIHQLNLDVQIEKISSEFDSWKTGTNQTDDVLLIGLKL